MRQTASMRSMRVCCHCQLQVVIMHRSVFESLMRTLKGHLLYQAEYLSRLLVKPPTTRSEAEVLKLASYLTSLPRFQEVPQSQLVQVAKEVTYLELTPGAIVCKQGEPADGVVQCRSSAVVPCCNSKKSVCIVGAHAQS